MVRREKPKAQKSTPKEEPKEEGPKLNKKQQEVVDQIDQINSALMKLSEEDLDSFPPEAKIYHRISRVRFASAILSQPQNKDKKEKVARVLDQT